MSNFDQEFEESGSETAGKKKYKNNYLLHIGLLIVTFITTTIAGAEWVTGTMGPFEFTHLTNGLPYSISILFIIACHEFGHYFAAVYHKVKATLPFFIPFPPIPGFINFGTMGAVIKTRTQVQTNKAMFDIGVAGPIAGFVATIIVLIYGFTNLPPDDYILSIHPEFFNPDFASEGYQLVFGDTLLFLFFKEIFWTGNQFYPPMSEIYHYPYLCVGWFGLLITAMNMFPVGQLDGGHISYTMFGGERHFKISAVSFIALFSWGVLGIVESFFNFGTHFGWSGWLFWALVLYFIIRLKHPPVPDSTPLSGGRMIVGYFSYLILLVSFSPSPLILIMK